MKHPSWYIELVQKTRNALKAFKLNDYQYDYPSCFLYMSDGEEDDWYDWDEDVCDIPVYNVSYTCHVLVAQDEECNMFPIWKGEMTPRREKMLREFQLRFAETGDY